MALRAKGQHIARRQVAQWEHLDETRLWLLRHQKAIVELRAVRPLAAASCRGLRADEGACGRATRCGPVRLPAWGQLPAWLAALAAPAGCVDSFPGRDVYLQQPIPTTAAAAAKAVRRLHCTLNSSCARP
eukprot:scaffold18021_cov61-Phaeocystis_antarctica.AAC.1